MLQQHVVTGALEQDDVGGLFDFVMPAAKQQRSRDVSDTSLASERVGSGCSTGLCAGGQCTVV